MLYCQSERLDHRARAAYALTFIRHDCIRHEEQESSPHEEQESSPHEEQESSPHEEQESSPHEEQTSSEVRVLACRDHAAQSDERYGLSGALALSRVEEVFEERVVVPLTRHCLETSALSPVTIAYDRACRLARDRGLTPVPTYRQPVRWLEPGRRGTGIDLVEAHVTLAVTRPRAPLPPR